MELEGEEAQESVELEGEEAQESAELEGEEAQESAEIDEKPSRPMVPKSRLDEVLAKQKALQKQLDEVNAANEKSETAPEAYDFDTKEVEYQNMVLDGESDKAVALRREIRKAERDLLEHEMRQEMSQTVKQDREMSALQKAASAMEEAYPEFDRNSDRYSEQLTTEVIELRDAFISNGLSVVDALSKAANFIVKDYGLEKVNSMPALAAAKPADEVAKKRSQVNKKLQAAKAQPPELPGDSTGASGEKALDVATLSEEEFAALPAATLKRLRGDIL